MLIDSALFVASEYLIIADVGIVGIIVKNVLPGKTLEERAILKPPLKEDLRALCLNTRAVSEDLFNTLVVGVKVEAENVCSDTLMIGRKFASENRLKSKLSCSFVNEISTAYPISTSFSGE